jgi:hypothetical protein
MKPGAFDFGICLTFNVFNLATWVKNEPSSSDIPLRCATL